MANTYLAADFGGGSGRVIAGSIANGKLQLDEVHRFTNRQIRLGDRLHWDFLSLFEEMKIGFRKAVQKGYRVYGIGVDTWGVDFGLIDKQGNLLGNPVCYRDNRTDGMPDKVFARINRQQHYAQTGIQVMPINTLFQLFSMKEADDAQLRIAHRLLFMPDLFVFFLTGVSNNEYCIASTSELLDAQKQVWASDLIAQLELPPHLFGDIVMPGSVRGKIRKDIAMETGLSENTEIITVPSHDTASAVVAIPSKASQKVFLSSGTWSLLGAVIDAPILTEQARKAGFSNEGAANGIRFLQNITGLWILQRLMAEWKEKGQSADYETLLSEATETPIEAVIDVDYPTFANPESMEAAIVEHCHMRGIRPPASRNEFVKCVCLSLAQRYKRAIEAMNRLLPQPVSELHIIGGGAQNRLLNQLTANALGIPVIAGPVEATAMGNILMQALAKKELNDMDTLKDVLMQSVALETFLPEKNQHSF